MTTLRESSLSLVMTRQFLQELTQSSAIPESVRDDAAAMLRHFPSNVKIEHLRVMEERFFSRPAALQQAISIRQMIPAIAAFCAGLLLAIAGIVLAFAQPGTAEVKLLAVGVLVASTMMMLGAGWWANRMGSHK